MSEADWTFMDDSADAATVRRGTTAGLVVPNGGGTFVFGFNSAVAAEVAVGLYANQVDFAPTLAHKGVSLRGVVKRGLSGGRTSFAPFFFVMAQGVSVNDNAYIFGLQDDDPYRLALRKGSIVTGLPAGNVGTGGILRRSTATYSPDKFHHLRIDVVSNTNDDVVIRCFESDLDAHPVTAPVWTPIAGLENTGLVPTFDAGITFIDDALGVNSGSVPYTSGRSGFGFWSKDSARRGVFDHIQLSRQG